MSEKIYNTFEEFNDECLGYDNDDIINKEACKDSWIACQKMNDSKIESLKSKFFEATKTYTNEIDELQEENAGLKEKIIKMKCCDNCHYNNPVDGDGVCDFCARYDCRYNEDRWEMK